MNLVARYVLRETFGAWLVVTLVLFVILMTNQFAEILDDAAADQLPRDAVFGVLGLTSLRYITMLTPIGLFLGIMLALARLNRDSEMAALAACGIG
ncbi:MAG: LptF/LptG family permease, partial [Gammaproteobacteria bacterium]|nr:LptF/LptG family permease [Gammaproteobacteria bacterium]